MLDLNLKTHPSSVVEGAFRGQRAEFAVDALFLFLIYAGSMLITVQYLSGNLFEEIYFRSPLLIYACLVLASLSGEFTYRVLVRFNRSRWRQLARLFVGALVGAALILVVASPTHWSGVYFFVIALVLGVMIILLAPRYSNEAEVRQALPSALRVLYQHRILPVIWIYYNVKSRYTQTWLGVAWIILLPLSTAVIFTFVFSRILHVNIGDIPFIPFFMTALLIWNFFNQCTNNSVNVILHNMSLINQVYFPREILILTKLGEALVDLGFSLIALLVINAAYGIFPNINYIYFVWLLLILICLNFGMMLFISYLSVVIRDIPQLIGVALQILFYLTPVIYKENMVPAELSILLKINPLTSIIEAFRQIILYGQPPSLTSLHYPLVLSVLLLYTGYRFFKANERRVTDFL